jgi:hypothetical protein
MPAAVLAFRIKSLPGICRSNWPSLGGVEAVIFKQPPLDRWHEAPAAHSSNRLRKGRVQLPLRQHGLRGLDDRHHFRFVVTPEDAAEMTDRGAGFTPIVAAMSAVAAAARASRASFRLFSGLMPAAGVLADRQAVVDA